MKNFTCLLLLAFALPACTRYQYLTLSGNELLQNDQKEFINENDSVKIVYNFNGYNCPVNITVYNKSGKPLYIDWKKSALISNGKATSYFSPGYNIDASISGNSLQWTRDYSTQNANVSGSITGQAGVEFIPPNAYISKKLLDATGELIDISYDSAIRRYTVAQDNVQYTARKREYTLSNSPLVFRSYLTLFFGGTNETTVENTFYLKQLMQATYRPNDYESLFSKRGDTYYVSEATGFGKGALVVGVIGTGIAAGVAEAEAQKKK